jgi:hypothetical protein
MSKPNPFKSYCAFLIGLLKIFVSTYRDDAGPLGEHVNIFINNQMIADRESLSDLVTESDEVFIMQALSGG